MHDTASELYNDFLGIYFNGLLQPILIIIVIYYNELPDAKRNKIEPKYYPDNLFFEG